MGRMDNLLYAADIQAVVDCGIDWSKLDGSSIGISGATGMIGTFLIDLLMHRCRLGGFTCDVIAIGRSEAKARKRIPYFGDKRFSFQELDITQPYAKPNVPADVVIHLASTTHPRAYATYPIATITSNINGLQNLMEWQLTSDSEGITAFVSSVEVYGENRGDVERFNESYCGYIDSNTLRAGYPESKRLGEALCQAYIKERKANVFIPRLPRVYGPTLLTSDTKALSQFLQRALTHKDIILKSEGIQRYSYLYVSDAVSGMLWVITHGETGMAYNIADERSDIMLRDIAQLVANLAGTELISKLPDEVERAGYSTATKAILDGSRLQGLGWSARYSIEDGLSRTMSMMRDFALGQ